MNQMNLLQSYPPVGRAGHRSSTVVFGGVFGLCLGAAVAVQAASQGSGQPCLGQATGTVEVEWRGKGGPQLAEGETKYAFASFAAFPESAPNGPRGQFTYSVFNPDLTLHRAIVVELFAVVTDPTIGRAWMAGIVVEDVKMCSGGHDGGGGGSGDTGHDESCDDGCSDTTHDSTGDDACGGGGSDTGGMPGGEAEAVPLDDGCSGGDDGTTHDDGCAGGGSDAGGMPGGESPDSTTHDDGCSGGDDATTHDDGCAGGGSDAGGAKVSGKDSRVGQILLAKVRDYGTPGRAVDHITWKWFSASSLNQLDVLLGNLISDNPDLKLCKKQILGGNLVVHGAR